MAEQLKQKQLRKTEQNGGKPKYDPYQILTANLSASATDSNGTVNGAANRPKPPGASMDLMSELNYKLRRRQNQEEIVSIDSTTSTQSTNSNDSAEKKDPPPPPKTWTKPTSNGNGAATLNGTQNGHVNGVDSPKVHKK
jgi:hypothetical protein